MGASGLGRAPQSRSGRNRQSANLWHSPIAPQLRILSPRSVEISLATNWWCRYSIRRRRPRPRPSIRGFPAPTAGRSSTHDGRARDDRIERARAVRIEDVIAQRGIPLKRVGPELVGPCPHCGGRDPLCGASNQATFPVSRLRRERPRRHRLRVFSTASRTFLDAVATLAGPPSDTAKETDEVRAERELLVTERRERSERECRDREESKPPKRNAPSAFVTTYGPGPRRRCRPRRRPISRGAASRSMTCPIRAADASAMPVRRREDAAPRHRALHRRHHQRTGWHLAQADQRPGNRWPLGPMKNHVIRLWDDAEITTTGSASPGAAKPRWPHRRSRTAGRMAAALSQLAAARVMSRIFPCCPVSNLHDPRGCGRKRQRSGARHASVQSVGPQRAARLRF